MSASKAGATSPGAERWREAATAARLLAVDPSGLKGAIVRSAAGPVRDRWSDAFRRQMPAASSARKVPAGVAVGRLIGGLDLAATLGAGRPMLETGLLAEADGGAILVAMAERLDRAAAAEIAAALDQGELAIERDGFSARRPARFAAILFDEGALPDEAVPALLAERVAFSVALDGVALAETVDEFADVDAARAAFPSTHVPDEVAAAIAATSLAFGVASLRALSFAHRATRACAALAAREAATMDDAAVACRLVFASRATELPAGPDDAAPPDSPAPDASHADDCEGEDAAAETVSDDMLVAAVRAAIPDDALARLREGPARSRAKGPGSRAGALRKSLFKGRPFGARAGDPRKDGRLKLVDTLRSAAPWQRMRGRRPADRIIVRKDDFRVARCKARSQSLTIFVVDASGSSAMQRLGEAKGAIELLLAECYSRRDEVALIAFRRRGADLILPPTRSLVRARRSLAELPGGGGTPLAAGLDAAAILAAQSAAKGRDPTVVLLTDGRANVSLAGLGGRAEANADALAAAGRLRNAGCRTLLFDTSARPEPLAQRLADVAGAVYLPLPFADAAALSSAVSAGRRGAR